MKRLFVGFLFLVMTSGMLAQDTLLGITGACGRADAKFGLKSDKAQQSKPQPKPGQALVYFFQATADAHYYPFSPVLLGVDGEWVGAYKQSSWVAVSVQAGDHKLCAYTKGASMPEMAHLTAEAGQTYYFRTREITTRDDKYLLFDTISAEQAKYMLTLYPESIATFRK